MTQNRTAPHRKHPYCIELQNRWIVDLMNSYCNSDYIYYFSFASWCSMGVARVNKQKRKSKTTLSFTSQSCLKPYVSPTKVTWSHHQPREKNINSLLFIKLSMSHNIFVEPLSRAFRVTINKEISNIIHYIKFRNKIKPNKVSQHYFLKKKVSQH